MHYTSAPSPGHSIAKNLASEFDQEQVGQRSLIFLRVLSSGATEQEEGVCIRQTIQTLHSMTHIHPILRFPTEQSFWSSSLVVYYLHRWSSNILAAGSWTRGRQAASISCNGSPCLHAAS